MNAVCRSLNLNFFIDVHRFACQKHYEKTLKNTVQVLGSRSGRGECRFLSIPRSAFSHAPRGGTAENLVLMRRIDEQCLETAVIRRAAIGKPPDADQPAGQGLVR